MKPYIIVFSTTTLNGKIASKTRYSKLSCPIDLMRLHKLRSQVDAVMVGANTAIIDDPSLRLKYFKGSNPARIIVDGLLRVPLKLRMFRDKLAKTIVLTSTKAPQDKIKKLRDIGVKVITLQSSTGRISLKEALRILYEMNIRKILVEGGGDLIWSLFKEKLVDEFRITKSAYIFGGLNAVSIVSGEGFSSTSESPKFIPIYIELCACGKDVHIAYRVVY